ncbi:MAG TPA: DUF4235 domain-containing protein [Egibacteraceae bacterium]|nr:DUF4235 domain-containing protein [Egibacteraceae bacterium]
MDQGAPVGAVSAGTALPPGQLDGLADRVAAVEAARARLGRTLDQFATELRAQVGHTVEKTAWKTAATMAAVVSGIAARKALTAGWRKARKSNPPTNPAAPATTWSEALAWTVATGIGVAVARLVATRGAAAGWRRATGTLPPGLEDVSP